MFDFLRCVLKKEYILHSSELNFNGMKVCLEEFYRNVHIHIGLQKNHVRPRKLRTMTEKYELK